MRQKMKHVNAVTAAIALFVMTAMVLSAGTAQAGPVTSRNWINIGDTANGNDSDTGYGGVDYEYPISDIGTTVEDWDAFYGDGSNIGDGTAVGSFNSAYNSWESDSGKKAPVSEVSFNNAAQYANWLTTGDATDGAYTIDGSGNVTAFIDHDPASSEMQTAIANSSEGIVYAIPTENEWYKAAYYSLQDDQYYDFADGDNSDPASGTGEGEWVYDDVQSYPNAVDVGGGLEQNSTRHMMGNIIEYMEDNGGAGSNGGATGRGGAWKKAASDLAKTARNGYYDMNRDGTYLGFRLVAIPEPSSLVLLGFAGLLLMKRRRV